MKKYYISGVVGATPGDAFDWYETAEEAIEARDSYKAEILRGVYDDELDLYPEDNVEEVRRGIADDVEAYSAECVRGSWKDNRIIY